MMLRQCLWRGARVVFLPSKFRPPLQLYRLDLRAKDVASTYRIHVAGNKVTSLDAHPFDANLLLTAGNDHLCKLFDVRMLRPLDGSSKCAPAADALMPCSFIACTQYSSRPVSLLWTSPLNACKLVKGPPSAGRMCARAC